MLAPEDELRRHNHAKRHKVDDDDGPLIPGTGVDTGAGEGAMLLEPLQCETTIPQRDISQLDRIMKQKAEELFGVGRRTRW